MRDNKTNGENLNNEDYKNSEIYRMRIKNAKNGDIKAFEELVLDHEKIVYNVAYRMMNNREDAYDISQEVFIKAFKSLINFNEQSSFSTWIYRITVNTCIDDLRKKSGKIAISMDQELENDEGNFKQQFQDDENTPEQAILDKEEQEEIVEALDQLSSEHKTVLILRELQGFSYDEIAEVMETTLGTVKSRISRARTQLKVEMLKIWERNKS